MSEEMSEVAYFCGVYGAVGYTGILGGGTVIIGSISNLIQAILFLTNQVSAETFLNSASSVFGSQVAFFVLGMCTCCGWGSNDNKKKEIFGIISVITTVMLVYSSIMYSLSGTGLVNVENFAIATTVFSLLFLGATAAGLQVFRNYEWPF